MSTLTITSEPKDWQVGRRGALPRLPCAACCVWGGVDQAPWHCTAGQEHAAARAAVPPVGAHPHLRPCMPPQPPVLLQGATAVAVQEVRRLQRFGVTRGELERYKTALLRDRWAPRRGWMRCEARRGRCDGWKAK